MNVPKPTHAPTRTESRKVRIYESPRFSMTVATKAPSRRLDAMSYR